MPLHVSRRAIMRASLAIAGLASLPQLANANGETTEGPAPDGLIDIEWKLTELAGIDEIVGTAPTLTVRDDGSAGGNTGCNIYFAEAAVSGRRISFSGIGQTFIACDDPVMNQEKEFLAALELVKGLQLGAESLDLLDKDDALLLRFAAS
ncbi:MAG: META domain-containing protein [Rhizobiaceae bacterium]|nr:META domain-containing protein [Rhizobiaceae bacterium]